jgi:hypothetical protein
MRRRRMPKRREVRATCPGCLRVLATFVPKGGDGTARFMRSHVCAGGKRETWMEAKGWEVSS